MIVGEANAGKSSLLNRLVGKERAIVSPEPGTTRDFIEESAVVGAHRLRFIDTAGLNPAPGPVERLGIAKTLECVGEADIVILVLDATRPTPPVDPRIAERLGAERTIVALNKIDLLPGPGVTGAVAKVPRGSPRCRFRRSAARESRPLKAELVRMAEGFNRGGTKTRSP